MKVCCIFSLELPHLGIFNINMRIILNYPKSAALGFFQGVKKESETDMANEPSMFEPLKV